MRFSSDCWTGACRRTSFSSQDDRPSGRGSAGRARSNFLLPCGMTVTSELRADLAVLSDRDVPSDRAVRLGDAGPLEERGYARVSAQSLAQFLPSHAALRQRSGARDCRPDPGARNQSPGSRLMWDRCWNCASRQVSTATPDEELRRFRKQRDPPPDSRPRIMHSSGSEASPTEH